jgi:hypothetical protein
MSCISFSVVVFFSVVNWACVSLGFLLIRKYVNFLGDYWREHYNIMLMLRTNIFRHFLSTTLGAEPLNVFIR